MKIKNTLLPFLLVIIQGHLLAQDITLKSVDEAISLALSKNIDYNNYVLNMEKAALEYKQAKSYRLPSISGTFSGQKNMDLATTPLPAEIFGGEQGQTVDVRFGQEYNYNAGVSISKQLFNQEASLQAKLSKIGTRISKVEQDAFEEVLKEQVSLYYYTATVSKKAIELGEQDLTNASQVYELTLEKYQEGIVDVLTVNSSKINQNSVKQNLNASRQLENQCVIELKKLLGMNPDDTLAIEGTFEYYLPQIYTVDELEPNVEIRQAELNLEQSDLQVKLSQSSLLPSLSLNSYLGRQQFRNDFGLSFDNNSWSNYSYLSLNLSIPIFSGFNSRRDIKKSKLMQQISFNETQQAEQHAILEDKLLISDFNYSLEDAETALETYHLYEENQQLTLHKYEEGLISLDHYLTAFEEYLKAENAYLNTISKIYTHYSQIIPRIQQ
ncbi:MAG: TolC family protein [Bacteroidota bacterium]